MEVRFFDSNMAVTLGCHDLSRHLRTLMLSSYLSKVFPRLKMIYSVGKPFLHFNNGFTLLHSKHLILFYESMFYCSFHIICPFMSHDGRGPSPSPNTSSSFSSSPTNRRYGPTKHHWMSFFCNYF